MLIFTTNVTPITNIIATDINIAKINLYASETFSIRLTIFESATISHTAEVILSDNINTQTLIIGIITIQIIIITPIIPIEFFKILVHPIIVSTESPIIFPTTGIKFETTALAVLDVNPSTELLNVPSIDSVDVKIVKIIPKNQIIDDF